MADDRVLRIHLGALADLADATVAALFSPAEGRLALRAQRELDQAGWDTVQLAWQTRRRELERGDVVRIGAGIVWPLLDGSEIVGVVYLDAAPSAFPTDDDREGGAILARRLGAVAAPAALGPQIAKLYAQDERAQLVAVLTHTAGNVSAARRLLGLGARDTLYARLGRYGLDVDDFRPAPRRRRRRI